MSRRTVAILAALVAAAGLAPSAHAYIFRLYPLKEIMREASIIAEGEVESADANKKIATVKITGNLKGECKPEKIQIDIGPGQMWSPDAILRHFVPRARVVVFADRDYKCLIYLNHFFFQVFPRGRQADPANPWWYLTHIEAYMNRTFDGPTPELVQAVKDMLAGKPAIPPNPRRKPLTKDMVLALPVPNEKGELGGGFEYPKPAAKSFAPDADGFLRNYLLLDPIPLGRAASKVDEATHKEWFDKEWFEGQFKATPKNGEKVKVGDAELAWRDYPAWTYYADIEAFAVEQNKSQFNSLYLGVIYVFCDAEIAQVTLSIGSDEACCWRVNGEEAVRWHAPRMLGKDQSKSKPLTLKKGMNVLTVAAVNGPASIGAGGLNGVSARFLDKDGKPVTSFTHDSSPVAPPEEH